MKRTPIVTLTGASEVEGIPVVNLKLRLRSSQVALQSFHSNATGSLDCARDDISV